MSWEDELLALARAREDAYQLTLSQMLLDHPAKLRLQLRHYLAEQADRGRLKRSYEDVPRLDAVEGGLQELVCEEVEFCSDCRLSFNIQVEQEQRGWLIRQFEFHLHLARRRITMVRIHLIDTGSHNPLIIPRCHFHLSDSEAHIPFPIMNPRLMLHLLCEHLEPDVGL